MASALESDLNAYDLGDFGQDFGNMAEELNGFEQLLDIMPNYAPRSIFQDSSQTLETSGRLTNVDNGTGHVPACLERPTSQDRARQRNNLAQKRHRERNKAGRDRFLQGSCRQLVLNLLNLPPLQVKMQELNTQFAETTRQLEELKVKQKSLEARNVLLEKLMHLNQQNQHSAHEQTEEA